MAIILLFFWNVYNIGMIIYLPSWGFPDGLAVKNLLASAVATGSIPELGRSHGEGNGNPLQYSCLGDPMDRGAWWVAVHGVTKDLDRT